MQLKRWNTLTILAIVLLALILRLQNLGKILGGDVVFDGYDSYYHMRIAEIIVKKGEIILYDSYLNYPYGLKISWLPLYHWVISIPGIMMGYTATEVFAVFLPVLMGVITVIAIYFIAYETTSNKYIALISSLISATIPKLVSISSAGSADYHAWNIAFFLLSILFMIKGIRMNDIKFRRLMFLLSGLSISILSLSWLGGSIYTLILALMCVFKIKKISFQEYSMIFLTPAILSLVFLSKWLFLPYLLIWLYIFFIDLAIKSGLRKVIGGRIDNMEGRTNNKIRRGEASIIVGISVVFLVGVLFMYISNISIVKGGINYILGINPYLPIIAEARSFQIFLMIVEMGIFAFLVAIPSAGIYFLKKEKGYELLFVWFVFSFVLALMQIRFMEVLAPVLSIFAGYGVAIILQASNIPLLESRSYEDNGLKKRDKINRTKGRGKKGKNVGKRSKKPEDFEWGRAEVVYSIVIIAFISSTGIIYSFKGLDITDDWLITLKELKEISPETSYYLSPSKKPEYSVLSWWDYGNWIVYLSKRPVVCNNFQAGAGDSAIFFATSNESVAREIIHKRGVKYIITDKKMLIGNETFKGKFHAILRIAQQYGLNEQTTNQDILEIYKNSILYKLHVEDAMNLEWVKLVSKHGDVKIFEVVES